MGYGGSLASNADARKGPPLAFQRPPAMASEQMRVNPSLSVMSGADSLQPQQAGALAQLLAPPQRQPAAPPQQMQPPSQLRPVHQGMAQPVQPQPLIPGAVEASLDGKKARSRHKKRTGPSEGFDYDAAAASVPFVYSMGTPANAPQRPAHGGRGASGGHSGQGAGGQGGKRSDHGPPQPNNRSMSFSAGPQKGGGRRY